MVIYNKKKNYIMEDFILHNLENLGKQEIFSEKKDIEKKYLSFSEMQKSVSDLKILDFMALINQKL
jgi:hypothetical protein